tara:strand:- start:166 stop:1482 length:1317 start_codon:yes stop_codon:yes gene_type:complete
MGTFRTVQNELLTSTEKELVDYNVYNALGTFKRTEQKDILIISPNQLIPLDRSMTVEYLRPINKVELSTKLKKRNISNNNPHFHYRERRWDLVHSLGLVSFDSTVVSDAQLAADSSFTKPVRSLSAGRCLKNTKVGILTNNDDPTGDEIRLLVAPIVETISDFTQVTFSFDVELGFSYYVADTSNSDYRLFIQIAYVDGSDKYPYNFTDGKFSDTAVADTALEAKHFKTIRNNKVNQWQNYSTILKAGVEGSKENFKILATIRAVTYSSTSDANNFTATLIDNFFVGNSLNFGDEVISSRVRSDSTKTFSGIYEQKDRIFSQELDDTRYDKAIIGAYKSRLRVSTTAVRLEELLTQEILNDFREYVKRYEGKFHNGNLDPIPVALHNKIWFKFNDLTEDVTAYIDSMTYNVKRNEYDLVTHVPNQDDDLSSDYQVTFE